MDWRHQLLSELLAGREVVVHGMDLHDANAVFYCLSKGILSRDLPLESGDETWIGAKRGGGWYDIVCSNDELIAMPKKGGHAIKLSGDMASQFRLNRESLFKLIAEETGCRPSVAYLAHGVWAIGTIKLTGFGYAKVLIVEQAVSHNDVVAVIERVNHKVIFVLGLDAQISALDNARFDRTATVITGTLEVKSEKFFCSALEERDSARAPENNRVWLNVEAVPPLLWVRGKSFKLPTKQSRPGAGVLILDYLLSNPGAPISCWDLESAVFPEKRQHVGIQLGSDAILDKQTRVQCDDRLKQLAETIASTSTAPAVRMAAIEEQQEIKLTLKKAQRPDGKTKSLGPSDSDRVRQRVRKNLGAVIKAVQDQDEEIGRTLGQALGDGDPVMFSPPLGWEV